MLGPDRSIDLQKLVELSTDLLCVVSPDGTLCAVNPAFERTFGCPAAQLVGEPMWTFVLLEDREPTAQEMETLTSGAVPDGTVRTFENRCRTASGDTRTMQWSATVDPATGRMYARGRDTTERHAEIADSERLQRYTQALESSHNDMRHKLEESNRDAGTDSLTGLLNRRGFQAAAATELSRSSRHRHSFGIALFDIDHFKAVNDAHGHDVGDAVLVEVARRLDSNRRQYDLVARWGGEEFVALFPETDLNDARLAAERLALAIGARSIEAHQKRLRITLSAGVVSVPDGTAANLNEVVAAADDALTRAKRNGRDRVEAGVLEPK